MLLAVWPMASWLITARRAMTWAFPRPTCPYAPPSGLSRMAKAPARCYDSAMSDRGMSRAKGGRRRFLVDGVIAVVAWVARGVRDSVLPILLAMLWNAVTRRPEQTGRATASVTLDDLTLKATGTVG